jgi:3-deoxy-D-manno-octulosonic-acid transferase
VHNVLEAAVYGVPVLFGPKIENSQEAKTLIEVGGGMMIKDKKEFYRLIRKLFIDEKLIVNCGQNSYEFVHKNVGTTDRIIKEIFNP